MNVCIKNKQRTNQTRRINRVRKFHNKQTKLKYLVQHILFGRDIFIGNFYVLFYQFRPKSNQKSNPYNKTNPKPNPNLKQKRKMCR